MTERRQTVPATNLKHRKPLYGGAGARIHNSSSFVPRPRRPPTLKHCQFAADALRTRLPTHQTPSEARHLSPP